jgi:hypothetical protein
MPRLNDEIRLQGPLGWDTLPAKDLTKGLHVVNVPRQINFDPLTKGGRWQKAGYSVASARLQMLVGPIFQDFYEAVRYGNYMQEQFEWQKLTHVNAELIRDMQNKIRASYGLFPQLSLTTADRGQGSAG